MSHEKSAKQDLTPISLDHKFAKLLSHKWMIFRDWNKSLCGKLNRSQKFYYFSILSFLLGLITQQIGLDKLSLSVFLVASILAGFGVISDVLIIYKKVWETNIGKAFILIGFALATNLAYAISSQIVNEILTFESTKLLYTINFVAVVLIPFFALALSAVIFITLIVLSQFYLLIVASINSFKNGECLKGIISVNIEAHPIVTFIVRVIAFSFVFRVFWLANVAGAPIYTDFVIENTKAFIYHLEAKSFSRCVLANGQKAIEINDKEIIIVEEIDGKYKFTPQVCEPRLSVKTSS